MAKKYIKGKDGKFKGSLPDPTMLPQPPVSNSLPPLPPATPAAPSGSYEASISRIHDAELIERFYANLAAERYEAAEVNPEYLTIPKVDDTYRDAYMEYEEDDYCMTVMSKKFKSLGGAVIQDDNDETVYNAEVSSTYFGPFVGLASKQFPSIQAAKPWLIEETNKRSIVLAKFKEVYESDEIGLQKTIETKLVEIGREDLVPLDHRMFSRDEGLEVNGSKVKIDYTMYPLGNVGIQIEKRDKAHPDETEAHVHYYKEGNKAVLFGLFVALSE
jgi:hypothetical protein